LRKAPATDKVPGYRDVAEPLLPRTEESLPGPPGVATSRQAGLNNPADPLATRSGHALASISELP
jgi:hypothetical protein